MTGRSKQKPKVTPPATRCDERRRAWWEAEPAAAPDFAEVQGADAKDQQTRRRALVLQAWASGPPGETLTALAKRAGIDRRTWWRWQQDPVFAAEFERVARLRARLQLEDVWQTLSAVDAAVLLRALQGDVAAAALVYKRLGIGREEVALSVEPPDREPTVEELEARLEQLQNVMDAASQDREAAADQGEPGAP